VRDAGGIDSRANRPFGGSLAVPGDQPVQRDAKDASERVCRLRLDGRAGSALDHARMPLAQTSQAVELPSGEVGEASSKPQTIGERFHNNGGSRDNLRCQESTLTTVVVGAILVGTVSTRRDRLEQLIRETAGRPADFARLVGVDVRWLNTIRSRLSDKPNEATFEADKLSLIVERTGVNPVWLMFGRGPERVDASSDPELAAFLARMSDDALSAARGVRARLSEVKAILAYLDAGGHAYTRESGDVDWSRAFIALRAGALSPSAEQTDAGMRQAEAEQARELGRRPRTRKR
jgi:hypothetical protein